MPPVEGRVIIISCFLGGGGCSPVLGLRGFQMHIRQELATTGGRNYSLLPTVPMLGYYASAVCSRSHGGVKPRTYPRKSSRRTCQHSGDAHETPLADELGSPLRLPLSPHYATLCLGRAERRPRWRSPASPLPSSPSLSKFWGEQEATKIDGFPHRQQAQAWGSLSARP